MFYKDKSFKENFNIFLKFQRVQNTRMYHRFQDLAENGIRTYCLNGNEISLFCFNQASHDFFKFNDKTFVVKDLFAFTFIDDNKEIDNEELKEQISTFLLNVIKCCSNNYNDEESKEFERTCNEQFASDLNAFYMKNGVADEDTNVSNNNENQNDNSTNEQHNKKPKRSHNRNRYHKKRSEIKIKKNDILYEIHNILPYIIVWCQTFIFIFV